MNIRRFSPVLHRFFPIRTAPRPAGSPGILRAAGRFRSDSRRVVRGVLPRLALLALGATSLLPGSAQAAVDTSFNPGANDSINTVAVQPDGKILIGGTFTSVAGATHNRVARLNADGTPDATFVASANEAVYGSAVQADGKLVVTGWFTAINGVARNYIARLQPDGTPDAGFNADVNNLVLDPTVQPDGRIVIVGGFFLVSGVARNRVARLNADGSLDAGFDPNANGFVNCVALQPDGKILIGGLFTGVGTTARTQLARLNPDGTVDAGFNPSPNGEVRCIAVQPDGKILIGGNFTSVGGASRSSIARLNADGSVDASFAPNANGFVNSMALQANGKILLAGVFTSVAGVTRNHIARVLADGTLDTSFDPNADNNVEGVTLSADGRILLAGIFTSVEGTPRNSLARLLNEPATQTLGVPTSRTEVQWLRGGSAPETTQVSFEYSPDGSSWSVLGAGTRIAGGWTWSGPLLPSSGSIRARGRTAGAYLNGGSGLVETVQSYTTGTNHAPTASAGPATQTVEIGSKHVVVTGKVADLDGDVLDYQWRKGATVLAEDSVGAAAGGALTNIPSLDLPSTDPRLGLGTYQIELRVSDLTNPAVSAFVTVKIVDTTAPKLVVPPAQIVIARSASGATVNYPAATATDAGGPVAITYSRNSGTTFPIGITQVTVTATDSSGNRTSGRFTVTVVMCTEVLSDLTTYVGNLNVNILTKASLAIPLGVAKLALAFNQQQVAAVALQAFIDLARLQRGHGLTAAQADYVIGEATRIRDAID